MIKVFNYNLLLITVVLTSSTRLESNREICQYWEDLQGDYQQLSCTNGRECGMGNLNPSHFKLILGMKALETWSVVRTGTVSRNGEVNLTYSKLALCSRVTSDDETTSNLVLQTSEEEGSGTEENNFTESTNPGGKQQDIETDKNYNTLNNYVTDKTQTNDDETTVNRILQRQEEEGSGTEDNKVTESTDAGVTKQDKETDIKDKNLNNYVMEKPETRELETTLNLIFQTSEDKESGTEENNFTEYTDAGVTQQYIEAEINANNLNNDDMEKSEKRDDGSTVNIILQTPEEEESGTEENNVTESSDAGVTKQDIDTDIMDNNLNNYVMKKQETREEETTLNPILQISEDEGSVTEENNFTEYTDTGVTQQYMETELNTNNFNNYVMEKTETREEETTVTESTGAVVTKQDLDTDIKENILNKILDIELAFEGDEEVEINLKDESEKKAKAEIGEENFSPFNEFVDLRTVF